MELSSCHLPHRAGLDLSPQVYVTFFVFFGEKIHPCDRWRPNPLYLRKCEYIDASVHLLFLPFPLEASSSEKVWGSLSGKPVDVIAQGFLLQDLNRLCLVSYKDTFPGSLHVHWEAVDHVREPVMSAAALGRESGKRRKGAFQVSVSEVKEQKIFGWFIKGHIPQNPPKSRKTIVFETKLAVHWHRSHCLTLIQSSRMSSKWGMTNVTVFISKCFKAIKCQAGSSPSLTALQCNKSFHSCDEKRKRHAMLMLLLP